MINRLEEFVELIEQASKIGKSWTPERKAVSRKIEESDPVVRQILNRAKPELGNYKRTAFSTLLPAKGAALQGIGLLRSEEDLVARLAPDSPNLLADRLHPWVWQAAQTFWESKHYTQAVEQAWKSVNAHLQAKVSRRDISDDDLINQTLTLKDDPKPGQPKLRLAGDRRSKTWVSRQRGLHALGQACASGIRNVVTHDHGLELSEQLALEYLATLSVLARWIDEAELEETDEEGSCAGL